MPDENLRNRDFFQHLLNNIEEGILVTDKDDQTLFANEPMARIAGLPQEQLLGREVLKDFSEDTLKAFRGHYAEARERLETVSFDGIAVVTPAGRRTLQSGSLVPMIKDCRYDGMICTIRDVTEQKTDQEALRCSEELYRTLVDNMQDALFRSDLEGNLIFTTPSAARILGCSSAEEMVGMNVRDDFHYYPEEATRQAEHLQKKGELTHYEVILKRQDTGKPVIVETSARFFRNPEGEILGIEGVYSDITTRKRAEEALRKSEAKYRLLHQSMQNAFASIDMDGTIIEFNDAFIQMTGYLPEEINRLSYRDITPEKWHAFEEEIIKNQVLSRGYSDIYEKEYRHKNGKVFPVALRTVLLRNEDHTPVGMWAIVHDITERRRKAAEREELIAELQQALSEVKTLSGLLPICSSCKKIRDDKGYWNQIESYITSHSDALFSHGICPECAKNLYPGLMKKVSKSS